MSFKKGKRMEAYVFMFIGITLSGVSIFLLFTAIIFWLIALEIIKIG